jgi:mono/diheme cytochrome c family protein
MPAGLLLAEPQEATGSADTDNSADENADSGAATRELDGALRWDKTEQRQSIRQRRDPAFFEFTMTNVSDEPVLIENIILSCGCTTVEGKEFPYTVPPKASETIKIRMTMVGRSGSLTKSVLVKSGEITWMLLVTTEILNAEGKVVDTRAKNLEIAKADRQAVFKGDCASCHAAYAKDQHGYALYLGACAICHDAKHRASMVPDLKKVDSSMKTDPDYWRGHIRDGKANTLMPAFAIKNEGILTEKQVESLVKYLTDRDVDTGVEEQKR